MRAKHIVVSRIAAILATAALVGVCASTVQAGAPFTIVAIPDTQNEVSYAPEMLQSQVGWIVNNATTRNIVCVSHQGDITNDSSVKEFTIARDKLLQLNTVSGLTWGTCAGNHDLSDYGLNYDNYFGPSNFAGKKWYGSSTCNHSSYQTFSAGGRNYLVLNIEYRAGPSVLDWAQGVINANPGISTIVNTHEYLNPSGGYEEYANTLWDVLVKDNSQIFMVLCGHWNTPGSKYATRVNAAGKPVFELMTDCQDINHGDGYMRLLEFDEANSVIRAKVFSPYNTTAPYRTGPANQFDIPMNFNDRLGTCPSRKRVSCVRRAWPRCRPVHDGCGSDLEIW